MVVVILRAQTGFIRLSFSPSFAEGIHYAVAAGATMLATELAVTAPSSYAEVSDHAQMKTVGSIESREY